MKSLLERSKDILTALGFICSGMAIAFLGLQINNLIIYFIGGLCLVFFSLYFILNLFLLRRDWIKYGWKLLS